MSRFIMSKYDIDIVDVRTALGHVMPSVVMYLLPNGHQFGGEWQVGCVGGDAGKSLRVALVGPKAGLWHDFATNEGGDILTLWMAARGVDFRAALLEAADFVGIKARSYTQSFRDECEEGQILCEKLRGVGLTMAERKRLTHIQKIIKVRERLNF